MSRVLSKADGAILLELARKSIYSVFDGSDVFVEEPLKEKFSINCGVFVTLRKLGKLRGCIGYARSAKPLYETLINAAKSAAFQDTRFMPLTKDEFDRIELEVSLLTEPTKIEDDCPTKILSSIKVGRDGILIKSSAFSGIFLPNQASSEPSWSSEDFLKFACSKFGLREMAWQDPDSRLYKFRAQIFTDSQY